MACMLDMRKEAVNMNSFDEMEETFSDLEGEDLECEEKGGYSCEPEYTKEEMKKLRIKITESNENLSSDDSEDDLDSSQESREELALLYVQKILYHATVDGIKVLLGVH